MNKMRLLADGSDSPWRAARWGLGDAAAAGAVALLVSSVAGVVAVAVLLARTMTAASAPPDLSALADTLMSNGPLLLVSLLGLWVGFVGGPAVSSRWRGNRSLAVDFGLTVRPRDVGFGAAAAAGMLAVSSAAGSAASAAGWDMSGADNASFLGTLPGPWKVVIGCCVVVGAPFAEELYFRGLLLRALLKQPALRRRGDRFAAVAAVAVSATLFGLAHASTVNAGGLFLAAVTASMGALLCVLALATGRLGAGLVAHMCVNLAGVVAVLAR